MIDKELVINGISKGDGYFYGVLCNSNIFVKISEISYSVEGTYEIDGVAACSRRCNWDKTFYWNHKIFVCLYEERKIYVFDTESNVFYDPVSLPENYHIYQNPMLQIKDKLEIFPYPGIPRISVDLNNMIATALPINSLADSCMAECCDFVDDIAYLTDYRKRRIYKYDLNANNVEKIDIAMPECGYYGIKIVGKRFVVLQYNNAGVSVYDNGQLSELELKKDKEVFQPYFEFKENLKKVAVWNGKVYIFSETDDSVLEIDPIQESACIIFDDEDSKFDTHFYYYDIYQEANLVWKTRKNGKEWVLYDFDKKEKYIKEIQTKVSLSCIKNIFENNIINGSEPIQEGYYYFDLGSYLKCLSRI